MREFNPKWIKIGAAAVIIIGLGGYWEWNQLQLSEPGTLDPSKPVLVTTVERGMEPDVRATFEERLAVQKQLVEDNEAAGTRDLTAILVLGNMYYGLGELEISTNWYRDILRTNPNDPPALENLGQAQLEMGDYAGAEASWRAAVNISAYEVTYLKLADLIDEHFPERTAEVQTILETAIGNLGQTTGLLTRLGRWYASQGMYDEAISHYQVASVLDPEDDSIIEMLAELKKKRAESRRD